MRALEVIVRSTGLAPLAVVMLFSLSCGAEPPSQSKIKVEQTVVPTVTPEPVADGPLLHPERAVATAPEEYRVRVETSEGVVVIRVVRAWAPHGADRFYNLVKLGYYDDTRFFRVIDGFMAQVGFHGDPEVTAAWRGAAIPDDPPQRPNSRGTVTFAKTERPRLEDHAVLRQHRRQRLPRAVRRVRPVRRGGAGHGGGRRVLCWLRRGRPAGLGSEPGDHRPARQHLPG